jgi:hypothetical protein
MMNSFPRDWRIHGHFEQTELMAGVLPRHGVHFLTGANAPAKDAVLADIAVAAASDSISCGLSVPDENGARSSLNEFFGLPSGAATGVAILTNQDKADSLSRSIAAATLARATRSRSDHIGSLRG